MSRRRTMLLLKVLVALAAALGTALMLFVWWFQNHRIYRFDTTRSEPSALGVPDLRVVRFRSEDDADISAWLAAPRGDLPLLVSFFGGFTSIGPSIVRIRPLLDQGFGIAMLVYRSSSGDGGEPSEAAFARDARALYDRLDALLGQPLPAARRVLYGFSLGASVAAGLAADRPAAGLIVESGFDRCCRWFQRRAFGLPMCTLMWRERHDVVDKLAGVILPKLFLHGAKDDAIPVAWGRALHDACVGEKRWCVYEQGGHTDLMQHGAAAEIAAFVATLPRPSSPADGGR